MILVDANLLIYAVDADSPHHDPARRWMEKVLSGHETVGLAWIAVLAFLRLTTSAVVMQKPLSGDQALAYVDEWMQQPCVRPVSPGNNHWPILRNLLRDSGTAANLTSDAHLAALAIEHGATVYSADNDFRRFAGIEHVNPLG